MCSGKSLTSEAAAPDEHKSTDRHPRRGVSAHTVPEHASDLQGAGDEGIWGPKLSGDSVDGRHLNVTGVIIVRPCSWI